MEGEIGEFGYGSKGIKKGEEKDGKKGGSLD